MQCSVEKCGREAAYKADVLCQKHYFRKRRNGTFQTQMEIKKLAQGFSRQPRITMPGRGYIRLYLPDHPLRDTQGYVSEHRKIMFDKIGYFLNACELCGKHQTWETVHIDHIDNNPKNNDPINLRPLCRSCNTRRNYPECHTLTGRYAVTLAGMTMTASEWSRVVKKYLSPSTILRRIKSGMTPEQALLTPKTTHKNNMPYTHEFLIQLANEYRAKTKVLQQQRSKNASN